MNRHDVAILSAKLAGVYAWLQCLGYLGAFATVLFNSSDEQRQLVTVSLLGPACLLGAAGAWLFFGSGQVARWLLPPRPEEAKIPSSTTASSAQTVAFSVVGLALVIFALPDAARYLTGVLLSRPFYADGIPLQTRLLNEAPQMVSVLLRLALGGWLFVQPQSIQKWWLHRRPGLAATGV